MPRLQLRSAERRRQLASVRKSSAHKKTRPGGSAWAGLVLAILVADDRLATSTDFKCRYRPLHNFVSSRDALSNHAYRKKILRKEVIQPQVPLRLPCYDLVPITEFILDAYPLAVGAALSDAPHFRGLTGGVYKAQEHIHRGMLTRDY